MFLVKKIDDEESSRISKLESGLAYECADDVKLTSSVEEDEWRIRNESKLNSIKTDLESKMNTIVERLDKFNADKEESNSKINTSLNKFNSYYDRKRLKKERKQNLKEEYIE